jgi:aminoglycoside phosphotransferase (APT) family kinase protein
MTTLARRDDGELARGVAAWCAHTWPDVTHEVVELARPNSGWSNETLLVTTNRDRFVVRMPPSLPSWPAYDLAAQARVLDVLAPVRGIPVPRVIALEGDDRWLGAPFLVMSHEHGRAGGEVPALEPWIADASVAQQRALHEQFTVLLASIHQFDWRGAGLEGVLRGGERSLAGEIAWWRAYIAWAADGKPTPSLSHAIEWCATNAPAYEPPASLCWGDVRLGNVLYSEDRQITAVLDWEMATIGPAEMDLGWYLVLDDLTTHYTKCRVAGFLSRAELVAAYEHALGRAVHDLAWYEIFALTRSIAINERQARLAATTGVAYPGVAGEDNPVLRQITRRIDAYTGS